MTYRKPADVTYTQMAMYFDEHIGDSDRNDDILFQYLYHLFYMLASKARYFPKFDDYDAFAIYAATRIYLRAINQADDPKSTRKIKSILNYIKSVLYPLKVDFQKESYDEIINPEVDDRIDSHNLEGKLHASIQADYNADLVREVKEAMKQLPKYVEAVVNNTPYRDDPVTVRRLYISVLLTFLDSITITEKDSDRIKARENRGLNADTLMMNILENEKENKGTVWRLNSSMSNYISVLTNRVKNKFSKELVELTQYFKLSEKDLHNIMMSAYNTDPRDNNMEEN